MELEVLGIGNAFTATHYQTSFLIRSQRRFLIDGPQALFRLLHERDHDCRQIDDVIITHSHGDHVAGFETLLLWKHYVEGKKVRLHTTRIIFEDLRNRLFGRIRPTFRADLKAIIEKDLEDYVDFHELLEDQETRLDEGLVVRVRYNWHPVPTLGLILNSSLGSIGISGDTCYRPSLLKELLDSGKMTRTTYEKLAGDWLWETDLIYHEADRDGPGSPHTLEEDLLKLASSIREKIRLVHVPDGFSERELPVAREGERATFTPNGEVRIELPTAV